MKPWLHFIWQRLGPTGRIGAWLLLASLLLWAVRVWPAQRNLLQLGAQLAEVQRTQQRQTVAKPRSTRDFYQHFPKLAILPDQLARLDAAADSVGLKISASQYQLQPVPALALQRYQVSLAIAGDYASLRSFVNMAMNESENAVFDEIRFERDPKGQAVTAHLRISFYYQGQPAAKGKP
jgi:Tfp pilus assembly protein PilO